MFWVFCFSFPLRLAYSGGLLVCQFKLKIRLFIKPYCPWCHQAQHWLDARGIKYETLDVIADRQAMAEMARLSGQMLAPVIEVDGRILADFGPEELEKFWESLNSKIVKSLHRGKMSPLK